MQYCSFSEFEEYSDAIQNIDWHCMLTGIKQSYWSFNHCQIGSIQIQGGYEGSPLIFEGATHRGCWAFYLQTSGEFGAVNGVRLDQESVFLIPPGEQVCFTSPGEIDWQCVHIPTEELFQSSFMPEGLPNYARAVKTGYPLTNRLRTLLIRLMQACELEPSVMTEPASIANFNETLLTIVRQILGFSNIACEADCLSVNRQQLITLAVQLIEKYPEKSLSVKVLAQNAKVSERTLRSAFVEYLGMPPLKYLTLCRLHQARKLLQEATPQEMTVTRVATLLGFWDCGRFAGTYQRLFGELPSTTLQFTSSSMRLK